MSPLDREVLAERTMAVERHLRRVADRLPESSTELVPSTDMSDAVILHLWQATQIVIAELGRDAAPIGAAMLARDAELT